MLASVQMLAKGSKEQKEFSNLGQEDFREGQIENEEEKKGGKADKSPFARNGKES
jgi:hypothetical protein